MEIKKALNKRKNPFVEGDQYRVATSIEAKLMLPLIPDNGRGTVH